MITIWITASIIEIMLKIVSKRVVLISVKKIERTNVNATNITLRLKFEIVSGCVNETIIATKFRIININKIAFLIS